jgi:hypothetical protein
MLLLVLGRPGAAQVTLEWGLVHMWVKGDASAADPDPAAQGASGWEARTRARYRFASIAAGLSPVRFSGDENAGPFFLVSYQVFPRLELRPGRQLNPFIEGNIGVLRGWGDVPELQTRYELAGRSRGVGAGAVVSVRKWLSIEGAAEWGRIEFDRQRLGGMEWQTAGDSRGHSRRIRIAVSWQLPLVFP